MTALREVVETRGVFCSLYSDRAGHFFTMQKAGGKVDRTRPTQVGRALSELLVKMIAAYSPEARGRSERGFGTCQGRLPQELRLHGITDVAAANQFLRDQYIGEFNEHHVDLAFVLGFHEWSGSGPPEPFGLGQAQFLRGTLSISEAGRS
jgi:hypothetical protein